MSSSSTSSNQNSNFNVDSEVLKYVSETELLHWFTLMATRSRRASIEVVQFKERLSGGSSLQKNPPLPSRVNDAIRHCTFDELKGLVRSIMICRPESDDAKTIRSWKPARKPRPLPAASLYRSQCFVCSSTSDLQSLEGCFQQELMVCDFCWNKMRFSKTEDFKDKPGFTETALDNYFGLNSKDIPKYDLQPVHVTFWEPNGLKKTCCVFSPEEVMKGVTEKHGSLYNWILKRDKLRRPYSYVPVDDD